MGDFIGRIHGERVLGVLPLVWRRRREVFGGKISDLAVLFQYLILPTQIAVALRALVARARAGAAKVPAQIRSFETTLWGRAHLPSMASWRPLSNAEIWALGCLSLIAKTSQNSLDEIVLCFDRSRPVPPPSASSSEYARRKSPSYKMLIEPSLDGKPFYYNFLPISFPLRPLNCLQMAINKPDRLKVRFN